MGKKNPKRGTIPKISVSPLFLIMVTALLLLDHTGAVPLCMLCAVIHEVGHLVFMSIFKTDLKEVNLSPFSVNIVRTNRAFPRPVNTVILLAGACFNFVIALIFGLLYGVSFSNRMGYFIAGNICIGVFNMLPLPSTDGYNILCLFLSLKAVKKISFFLSVAVIVSGVMVFTKYFNPFLCLFGIYILFFSLM